MGKDDIITFSELCEIYGFGKAEATRYLNMRGCPVLPRKKGQPYKVVKSEFDEWLKAQRQ